MSSWIRAVIPLEILSSSFLAFHIRLPPHTLHGGKKSVFCMHEELCMDITFFIVYSLLQDFLITWGIEKHCFTAPKCIQIHFLSSHTYSFFQLRVMWYIVSIISWGNTTPSKQYYKSRQEKKGWIVPLKLCRNLISSFSLTLITLSHSCRKVHIADLLSFIHMFCVNASWHIILGKQKVNHVFPWGRLCRYSRLLLLTPGPLCSFQHCPSRLRSHIPAGSLHVTRCLHQPYSDTHLQVIMPTFTSLRQGAGRNGGHFISYGHCRVTGISGCGPDPCTSYCWLLVIWV